MLEHGTRSGRVQLGLCHARELVVHYKRPQLVAPLSLPPHAFGSS